MTRSNKIIFKGVVRNGKTVFDHPKLYESHLLSLEDQRFDLIIEKESKPKTVSQLGYLFGGIIEASCLGSSTAFQGYTKEEVLDYLLSKLTSYPKEMHYPDGHIEIVICHDEISLYDQEALREFIDKVIIYLSMSHGIVVLSPAEYQYKKYFTKIPKEEKEW